MHNNETIRELDEFMTRIDDGLRLFLLDTPEEVEENLTNLDTDRVIDLLSAFMKMQKLSNTAIAVLRADLKNREIEFPDDIRGILGI